MYKSFKNTRTHAHTHTHAHATNKCDSNMKLVLVKPSNSNAPSNPIPPFTGESIPSTFHVNTTWIPVAGFHTGRVACHQPLG